MTRRLHVHDIRQFDENGIRRIRENRYKLKEGTIRTGTATEDFYMDRARRLYCYEGVDRIILLSRKIHMKDLENLAEKIMEKSQNEWKRFPDDLLLKEDEFTFADDIEIIEKGRESGDIEITQINLVSNLYYVAKHYLSETHEGPNELPMKLVRILAGLYPKEWKSKLPYGIPHYDPKDILRLLVLMTSDKALIAYFEFFGESFVKRSWNIEEILRTLEDLLKTPTSSHAGLNDLHRILKIVHESLSSNTASEIIELRNEINNYFLAVPSPELYTDMLFRKYLQLFSFLQQFEEADYFQDKLYFLEESRKKIRESEVLVEDKFVEPFRSFYLSVLKRWMDITFEEGGKLLGRALLEARLQTKTAIRKEKLLISLNLKNIGTGTAKDIKVILNNSSKYDIFGNNQQIVDILQGNRDVDVEFQIRPHTKESVNLAFSISHGESDPVTVSDKLIFVEQEEFRAIPNPYNFTKPAEEDMFFGREDLFQWIETNMKGPTMYQNVLITGQRRTGKTSFLKQLQKHISSGHYCIFIDLQLYPNLTDVGFLYQICRELHRSIPNSISPPNPQEFAKKSYMAFGDFVRSLLSEVPDSKRIILLFDEFNKVEFNIREGLSKPGFLAFFRGFFQHSPRVNAVVGGNFDFGKLSLPEWQELFTTFNPKRIGVLDEKSATALVTRPVRDVLQYDQYAVKKILDFSGRNPYYIQVLCHTLINHLNERKEKNFVEIEDISTEVLSGAREKAEPTIRLTWEELDPLEKNVLFALSYLRDQYKRSVKLKEIEQYLKQNNIGIKRWRLFGLLGALKEKGILTKSGESEPFYDFSVLLLGEWIAEHGNFNR